MNKILKILLSTSVLLMGLTFTNVAWADIWPLIYDSGYDIWVPSSPVVADINNDGQLDILFTTTGYWNFYCINKDGTNVWKSGKTAFSLGYNNYSSPAVADLDGDGSLETVVNSGDSNVYCINKNGEIIWHYVVGKMLNSISPAIADLSGDGNLKIIDGSNDGLFCINKQGKLVWKYAFEYAVESSPVIVDLNNDGTSEILITTHYKNLNCISKDGQLIWKYSGAGYFGTPAAIDLDNDGNIELLFSETDYNTNNYYLHCLDKNGHLLWKMKINDEIVGTPAIADLDGDVSKEIIFGFGANLYCIDTDGKLIWQYNTSKYNYPLAKIANSPAIADLNGDGNLEMLVGANDRNGVWDDNNMYCLDKNGRLVWKYQVFGTILSSPAIADLDGDGNLEVLFGASDSRLYCIDKNGKNFIPLQTQGPIVQTPWPMFQHDLQRTGFYDRTQPKGWTLNMSQVPWYQNAAPYNSTGATTSQMLLNFIRTGAGTANLTQNQVYEYAKTPNPYGSELNPDEIAKALGHFDPYDTLISNWSNSYDALLGGNPYKGYNFSVENYPSSDENALNEYMRDICHWMSYTVTKEDWWKNGDLVTQPNTPAIIPLYGSYNHWVTVAGFSASANPLPEPHTNPWKSPDFTVYGFWVKDPLINSIGQDTYITAAECKATYFRPVSSDDNYNGKFVQVAEPPPQISQANVQISQPTSDPANLEFMGVKANSSDDNNSAQLKKSSLSAPLPATINKPPAIKKSWRDILPAELLADANCQAAFNQSVKGTPVLVKRTDIANSDYYLLPFNKYDRRKGLVTSAVIILDATNGYFKEASWTKAPEKFLKINDRKAIDLTTSYIFNDFSNKIKKLPRMPNNREYLKQKKSLYEDYQKVINYVRRAKPVLLWKPNSFYSLSPYQPYWKIDANSYIWYVTQEAKVTPEVKLDKTIGEIRTNRKVLERFR